MVKALTTKNVVTVLAALALTLGFTVALTSTAKAATMSAGCYTFTQNSRMGSNGGEVMWVQKFLNSHGFTVAITGAGSAGNETSHFGPATKRAVKAFQNAYASDILIPVGLSMGTGNWFSGSRAKANAICGGNPGPNPTPNPTPTGTGITISSAAQPANSLAPQGTSRVPLTTFTLTNNTSAAVTITGVTVMRSGLAQDAVFSGIILVDQNGLQVGVSRTFDSNHMATIGDTFTIPAGASMTYTVAGNMAASLSAYAGQVVGVSVTGINTNVPVSGSLPISGAQQTINATLTTGTVTANVSSFDPQAPTTKHIGDLAVRFSGARFTAGSAEDVKMYSVRFRLNGSIGSTDLTNLMVNVNGTAYPTTWSADGRYVIASFAGGILITKGNSVDVYLQGDITGGNASGRTAEFDIDRTSDVYFVGQTYGYGILPAIGGSTVSVLASHNSAVTTGQPYFQGAIVTIQGGTATTISNATSVAAANVALNVPNQVLGGFDVNFTGEPVTVQSMVVTAVATGFGGSTSNLRSVSLVNSSGVVVAGPVDFTGTPGAQTATFTNSITFPTGLRTYTFKGTVPSDYTNGASIVLTTNPSAWTGVQGQITGNTVAITTVAFPMNTMTVRSASLAVTASTNPAANTVVAGGQKVLFANIQLDASQSGEDIRIASFPVFESGSGAVGNLNSCQVWDGTTSLNNNTVLNTVVAGQNTITLDNSLTVAKGTTKTLAFTCNLSAAATPGSTYQFGVSSVGFTSTGVGATSGNTVTPAVTTTNSGLQTVASAASLTVNIDPSSPAYAVAAAGTVGVNVGVIKLRPTNEGVNLTKLGLTLTGGLTGADVSNVTLYNNGVAIGTASFNGGLTSATSTLTTSLNLPVNVDTLITIKADLAAIGVGQTGTEGQLIKVDPLNFEGTGVSSGTTVRGGATAGVAGVRVFKSFPTLALGTLPSTGIADGRLIRFQVTADSHGNVGLASFNFLIATSTASVSAINMYGYTDAGYSTPISGVGTGGLVNTSTVAPTSGAFTITPTASSIGAIEVPAGQTYYFEVRGTVAGSIAGANVATTLLGDAAFAGMSSVATLTGASKNFIWSPNATTTSVTTVTDWTDGAALVGLPSSGLIQNRGN